MRGAAHHEILIFRNTHDEEGVRTSLASPEAEAVLAEHGIIVHMTHHDHGLTPQQIYDELYFYERDFNPKDEVLNNPPAPEIKHLDLFHFFAGLAALLQAGHLRAEMRCFGAHGQVGKTKHFGSEETTA